jgi:transposase
MTQVASFVGIDVAKAHLDIAVRPCGATWRVANDDVGVAELHTQLQAHHPDLVVLEATGGHEVLVASTLAAAGLQVAVVNPRHVRHFARAIGQLAKTDRLDAQLLARFAEGVRPEPRPLPDERAQLLRALLARRRQVVGMLVAEQQRLGTVLPALRERVHTHLDWLRTEREQLTAELQRLLRQSPVWQVTEDLVRSVPGVGVVIAATLVAELPELGQVGRKQLTALVGVAPLACDSGTVRGRRMVWGGRASVRAALYMGTVVALRCNPVVRAFYDRLRNAGKPAKVALTACIRKLLLILHALVRKQERWHAAVPA